MEIVRKYRLSMVSRYNLGR